MAQTIINNDVFNKQFKEMLNAAMLEAAEPIIQEALKKAEIKMRESLAVRLIALIQDDFDVRRFGHDLHIVVKQREGSAI